MIQLDNVKMWESIISIADPIEERGKQISVSGVIRQALKDQGLEYKDGHIVSITEPKVDFKIEKGKWYVCINPSYTFTGKDLIEGKVYYAPDNGQIQGERGSFLVTKDNYDYFLRPATEEEIKENNGGISPKFKEGDKVYNRKLNAEGLILGTSYEDGNVTIKSDKLAPNVFPISIEGLKDWELVEPKQENSPILSNSSNTAKNDELTEFEKELVGMITFAHYGNLEKMKWSDWAIARAKDLLSIARKEIAEGINTEELIKQWEYKKIHSNGFFSSERDRYKEGVEDTIKKIKEG